MDTCTTPINEILREHNIELLLLGFPKCGTTAFADWLSTCPQVDVSNPKETFLLCPEFAGNLKRSAFRDTDVEACFGAQGTQGVRMEASTLNVYSPALLDAVRETNVKCILLTRDPVQASLSWHNQVINAGFQLSEDFGESWAAGLSLDDKTGQGFLRRYEQVASYGQWCSRWIDAVGHERCLLLEANDLRNDPDSVKARLEPFLGQRLDLPSAPPERNKFAEPRNKFLYDAIRGSGMLRAYRNIEKHLQSLATVRRIIRDKIVLKPAKKEVRSQTEDMLRDAFAADQQRLTELASLNLATWTKS